MKSIELFAGAGGLALGLANAGFTHEAVLEWNANACKTLRRNKADGIRHVKKWSIIEGDVRAYGYEQHLGQIDLVAGGPPCQPFSMGGKHRAQDDQRNMFPEAVRAVRETTPLAFMFENVKGLLRQSFSNYYSYIIRQLSFPDVLPVGDEDWGSHNARLEKLETSGKHDGLRYNVIYKLVDAADFGIPQRRHRVFIIGVRSDLAINFRFPFATHGEDRLLYDQWVSGEYWDEHRIAKRDRPLVDERIAKRVKTLQSCSPVILGERWRTVRDAIADLPEIAVGETCNKTANHFLNPGARSYPGHDGSPLDRPSKALKAGDHGVPGGENTLRYPDNSLRYFSVRECARLQTFPDEWFFEGSWTESMRQLGNAVPVKLAEVVAKELASSLNRIRTEKKQRQGDLHITSPCW